MNRKSLQGKHIVLGISGGIAAYKSAYLLRLLIKRGCEVQVVMTDSAKEFITPVTMSSLSGKPVVSEFFTANTGEWHSHVDLGLWADLMVVAPATANTLGKMANGIADNMLVTTYLSAKEDVMVAPAMDLDMWAHPSTQRNIKILEGDGVQIIQPGAGELASGLVGRGRMAEPEEIVAAVEEYFDKKKSLSGVKVVVTAGPTYENIDPVRFIGNYSSGKMGYSIADEFARRGADVTIVSGPVSVEPVETAVNVLKVTGACQMLEETLKVSADADYVVFAAAVADYRPEVVRDTKIKRGDMADMALRLVRNPDIAATIGAQKGDRKLVGFALETDNEVENALDKLIKKNLDWVVLNSMRDPEAGFMKDTNRVTIIGRNGFEKRFEPKSKRDVAKDIVDTVTM